MNTEVEIKSKIVLVTGGSRSGKSEFAEGLLKEYSKVLYIATAIVTDHEMENRIQKHIERRNKSWETFEGFRDLDVAIEESNLEYIMLDCVTVMITNLLFEKERDFDRISIEEVDMLLQDIKSQFERFIKKAREKNKTVVMVTNEVGLGLVPEYKLSRIFRDIAGTINQCIAALSDEVYFVACGLPLKLK